MRDETKNQQSSFRMCARVTIRVMERDKHIDRANQHRCAFFLGYALWVILVLLRCRCNVCSIRKTVSETTCVLRLPVEMQCQFNKSSATVRGILSAWKSISNKFWLLNRSGISYRLTVFMLFGSLPFHGFSFKLGHTQSECNGDIFFKFRSY